MPTDATLRQRVCIEAGHPCLPGHFPGQPVVPGVVLLDRIAACLQQAGAGHLASIAAVKFLHPLLPEETAELSIRIEPNRRVHFCIQRANVMILTGTGELA